ncbi:MAG TPA: glycosyltransferase [Candidatus Methylomirabilis sp.]|nr:glycosyltransferase [Candidatus Methylomirabilis sp.]
MATVSVVLETDSVDPSNNLTLEDCLDALIRQDYPGDLIEVIAVDGGKVPGLEGIVRKSFPAATVLSCPGASKFEQKNLGMKAAHGDIIALLDADCAAPLDWISVLVAALDRAPADVAGVQGVTDLSRGFLSPEVTALLYGIRNSREGNSAERLVTDNLALRRDAAQKFAFEHPAFVTAVDSLLLHRLIEAGYRIKFCEGMRMTHSYPRTLRVLCSWVLLRAWAVGYFMVRTRQLERDLPGSMLVRAAGLGWPLLAAAKALRDATQVWRHRRRVEARFLKSLPVLIVFEITLFLGGLAALLRFPAPRVSA